MSDLLGIGRDVFEGLEHGVGFVFDHLQKYWRPIKNQSLKTSEWQGVLNTSDEIRRICRQRENVNRWFSKDLQKSLTMLFATYENPKLLKDGEIWLPIPAPSRKFQLLQKCVYSIRLKQLQKYPLRRWISVCTLLDKTVH